MAQNLEQTPRGVSQSKAFQKLELEFQSAGGRKYCFKDSLVQAWYGKLDEISVALQGRQQLGIAAFRKERNKSILRVLRWFGTGIWDGKARSLRWPKDKNEILRWNHEIVKGKINNLRVKSKRQEESRKGAVNDQGGDPSPGQRDGGDHGTSLNKGQGQEQHVAGPAAARTSRDASADHTDYDFPCDTSVSDSGGYEEAETIQEDNRLETPMDVDNEETDPTYMPSSSVKSAATKESATANLGMHEGSSGVQNAQDAGSPIQIDLTGSSPTSSAQDKFVWSNPAMAAVERSLTARSGEEHARQDEQSPAQDNGIQTGHIGRSESKWLEQVFLVQAKSGHVYRHRVSLRDFLRDVSDQRKPNVRIKSRGGQALRLSHLTVELFSGMHAQLVWNLDVEDEAQTSKLLQVIRVAMEKRLAGDEDYILQLPAKFG